MPRPPRAASLPIPFADVDTLFAAAIRHDRSGAVREAEQICRQILARNPKHVPSLVLLGSITQSAGRNQAAVRILRDALTVDDRDPTAHDAIATPFQALGRREDAGRHYMQAIACGLADVEQLVKQTPAISACLVRLKNTWPRRLTLEEITDSGGLAHEALLLGLLRSRPVRDVELERLLTALRHALLRHATEAAVPALPDAEISLCCALAQQCFINEYVFAVGDTEFDEAQLLRAQTMVAIQDSAFVEPLQLAVFACYFPLHDLADLPEDRPRPASIDELMTQQVREPLQETREREAIPALTAIEDRVSLAVQQQYEENPYPRWTVAAPAKPVTIEGYIRCELPFALFTASRNSGDLDILVAGCGTGKHPIELAQTLPEARLLAVDLSKTSLAYARRKTGEAGIGNIAYGQADILALPSIGRDFDVIESIGVLHHLSDPFAGWRILLSLLRPGGLMAIGLYSEMARRSLTALRASIAERGLQPTAKDIRGFRQDVIGQIKVPQTDDFFCTSGCRDLLFNVMEHRFTVPQIKSFIDESGLKFLGFAVPAAVEQQFRRRFPDDAALVDLDRWHEFELSNPRTFLTMYKFWLQKTDG